MTCPACPRPAGLAGLLADRVQAGVLVLLAQPLILLLLNPVALTPDAFAYWVDPWIYFGFATNFQELDVFSTAYNATRLPAILPFWPGFQLMSPWWAHHVSHLALYYASIFSLYAVLRRYTGPRGALLGAALLGCNVWYLRTASWYLHDFPAMTYLLVGLWLLTRSVSSPRWWRWMSLAGVACAGMVYSNVFWCNFGLGLAAYHWYLDRSHGNRNWWRKAGVLALGFAASTLALAAFYRIGYGSLMFLDPMFKAIAKNASGPMEQRAPDYAWVWVAVWVMPAVLAGSAWLLTVTARVWRGETSPPTGFLTAAALALAVPFGMLVFWEWRGIPWIQVDYYGTTLLPVSFLLLGAALASSLDRLRPATFAIALGLTLAALMIPLRDTVWPRLFPYTSVVRPVYYLAGGVAGVSLIILFPRRGLAVTLGGLLLSGMNLSAEYLVNSASPTVIALEHGDRTAAKRDGFACVCSSVAWLKQVDPRCEGLFWYNRGEPLGPLFRAVSCTRMWWDRLVSEQFPLPIEEMIAHTPLRAGQRLVILTADEDAVPIAEGILGKQGWYLRVVDETEIHHGPLGFRMLLADVCDGPRRDDSRVPMCPVACTESAPRVLTSNPEDLARQARRLGGVAADGWLEKQAHFVLLAAPGDDMLALTGEVPFCHSAPEFYTEITFRVDGQVVDTRRVGNGTPNLRVPVKASCGPHLVEVRFSDTHRLSDLDPRETAMRLGRVEFVRDDGGWRRPILDQVRDGRGDFTGIFADGWLAGAASCLLSHPGGNASLVLEGELPEIGGAYQFTSEVELLVGGRAKGTVKLRPGPVSVRVPVDGEAGPVSVGLRFSAVQRLPAPDGRAVGMRLTKLAVERALP